MQVAQEMLQDVEETMVGVRVLDGVWVAMLGSVHVMLACATIAPKGTQQPII